MIPGVTIVTEVNGYASGVSSCNESPVFVATEESLWDDEGMTCLSTNS